MESQNWNNNDIAIE